MIRMTRMTASFLVFRWFVFFFILADPRSFCGPRHLPPVSRTCLGNDSPENRSEGGSGSGVCPSRFGICSAGARRVKNFVRVSIAPETKPASRRLRRGRSRACCGQKAGDIVPRFSLGSSHVLARRYMGPGTVFPASPRSPSLSAKSPEMESQQRNVSALVSDSAGSTARRARKVQARPLAVRPGSGKD